ncbi:MAG: BGTF surface domain-containing protein, partial [Haloferacaceae archaeon]
MVPQRLDAPTRILLSGFLVASLLLAGAAGVTSAQSSSVSFATTNGTVTVDPGPSATVRGTSNYEAGTTLTVRLRTTGDTDPRKLATQTVTVDEDGA